MNCQTFIIICLIILVVIYYLPKNDNFRMYDSNYQRRSMLDNQPANGFLLDTSAPYR